MFQLMGAEQIGLSPSLLSCTGHPAVPEASIDRPAVSEAVWFHRREREQCFGEKLIRHLKKIISQIERIVPRRKKSSEGLDESEVVKVRISIEYGKTPLCKNHPQHSEADYHGNDRGLDFS